MLPLSQIIKQADEPGRVEPGLHADLVLLRADPLTDIRHTRRIEMVIHGGHVCLPADLLRGVAMD